MLCFIKIYVLIKICNKKDVENRLNAAKIAKCITYMAKYTACKNSKRNWLDTGIRGKSLGTKLDSLPYEER